MYFVYSIGCYEKSTRGRSTKRSDQVQDGISEKDPIQP